MGFNRSFTFGVFGRLIFIFGCAAAILYLIQLPQHFAAIILCVVLCVASVVSLISFVGRSNRDMIRFVDAFSSRDLAQSFSARHLDGNFTELADSLQIAMDRQRVHDQIERKNTLMLSALVDDAPVALLKLQGEQLTLINKMARRLLGGTASTMLLAFENFGSIFIRDIRAIVPGERKVSLLQQAGSPTRVMLTASDVRSGTEQTKIISVQPIQSELDTAEMALSRDLVRILTHEIMNSLTPVTSLAKTASVLMQTADIGTNIKIAEARAAVDTVARRSDSLMQFVRSYRALTVMPTLRQQSISIAAMLDEMVRLFEAEWPRDIISLRISNTTESEIFEADPDLISQLLINLLRNAAEATLGYALNPEVVLSLSHDGRGHMQCDISDNGPGILANKQQDIFLPFFTTKTQGTGVGLSLCRQIAVSHGGTLSVVNGNAGQTCIRLVLPV